MADYRVAREEGAAHAPHPLQRRTPRLTSRGVCALILGGVLALVSIMFAQRDIGRLAVFVVALPVLSWLLMFALARKVTVARRAYPATCHVGDSVDVELSVHANRFAGTVHGTEHVSPGLGASRRLGWTPAPLPHKYHYTLGARSRGVWTVGPLEATVQDPLGLATRGFDGRTTTDITVLPAIFDAPTPATGASGYAAGQGHSPGSGISGAPDTSVRAYRTGDDLRRVHWRSTAKRGSLMVRQDARRHDRVAVVALDTRRSAYGGDSLAFEWMVSAAASIMTDLARREWEVRLVGAGEPVIVQESQAGDLHLAYASLARIQPTPSNDAAELVSAITAQRSVARVVVCAGRLTASDSATAHALTEQVGSGLLLSVRAENAVSLAANGWSHVSVDPHTDSITDVCTALSDTEAGP